LAACFFFLATQVRTVGSFSPLVYIPFLPFSVFIGAGFGRVLLPRSVEGDSVRFLRDLLSSLPSWC